MDRDRRQSMRVATSLPCQWQIFARQPSNLDVQAAFGLDQSIEFQPELIRLNDEIHNALPHVTETNERHLLAALNHKIDLIVGLQAGLVRPPERSLVLSLTGLDMVVEQPAPCDGWVGVHLVLDNYFNFVGTARVTHCTPDAEAYHLGLALVDLNERNARRLTRYVMRLSSREAD